MKHDIILIAAEPWEGSTWRRRHHIAWSLAKENRVFFIEPPTQKIAKNIIIKHQGRNLYSVSIKKVFPDRIAMGKINISVINEMLVRRKLRQTMKEMGIKSPLLWVYFSLQHYNYFDLFNEKLVLIDWHDMFTAYFGWTSEKYINEIQVLANKIIKQADIIFAVSKELYEYLNKKHEKVYFIPHGVNNEIFDTNTESEANIKKLSNMEGPKIGYLGAIQYKIDFELLNYIAMERKEWKFLLAGRKVINNEIDNNAFARLLENNNVIYLGEIAKEQIPNYLKILDVCVIPFKKIAWNHYVSGPLKLWEYITAGKPIVATDGGSRYECDQFVRVASSKEDFVQSIAEALIAGNDQSLIKMRKSIAKSNSWDSRVQQMMSIIDAFLSKKIISC